MEPWNLEIKVLERIVKIQDYEEESVNHSSMIVMGERLEISAFRP